MWIRRSHLWHLLARKSSPFLGLCDVLVRLWHGKILLSLTGISQNHISHNATTKTSVKACEKLATESPVVKNTVLVDGFCRCFSPFESKSVCVFSTFVIDILEMTCGKHNDQKEDAGSTKEHGKRDEPITLVPIQLLDSGCKRERVCLRFTQYTHNPPSKQQRITITTTKNFPLDATLPHTIEHLRSPPPKITTRSGHHVPSKSLTMTITQNDLHHDSHGYIHSPSPTLTITNSTISNTVSCITLYIVITDNHRHPQCKNHHAWLTIATM